jgi:hypothetical protein
MKRLFLKTAIRGLIQIKLLRLPNLIYHMKSHAALRYIASYEIELDYNFEI